MIEKNELTKAPHSLRTSDETPEITVQPVAEIAVNATASGGRLLSPIKGSLAFALCYVALWWLVMLALYRRKIFIKV